MHTVLTASSVRTLKVLFRPPHSQDQNTFGKTSCQPIGHVKGEILFWKLQKKLVLPNFELNGFKVRR
jgi:hypothetical protein